MSSYSSPFNPTSDSTLYEKDRVAILCLESAAIVRILTKLGFNVVQRSSECLLRTECEAAASDIIVVDTSLCQNAQEFVEFLRSYETTKNIPIIAYSSSTGDPTELSNDLRYVEKVISENPAIIAGKVATTLRLAKMRGSSSIDSSMHEKNLALKTALKEFKREWDEAKMTQASLLSPTLPHMPNLDASILHQPLNDIGGDWYFLEPREDNTVFLALCDVTGHGLSAAFLGSMTRLALHAGKEKRLPDLIAHANNLLTPELPEGRFVTCISCNINSETGSIELVRAGHPPALVLRNATRTVEEVKSQGFALGFMQDVEFTSVHVQLEVGDSILFYTDGISEAANRYKEQYGMARLKAALQSASGLTTAAEISATIKRSLDEFLDGRRLNDDLSIVVLTKKQ